MGFDKVLIYDTCEDYEILPVAVVWEQELLTWKKEGMEKIQKHLPSLKQLLPL